MLFRSTGKSTFDPNGYNVKSLAEKYGLWQKNVFEYPTRIPYLDVLTHLETADAVFILGSTEPHYTPSKTYQGVLSKKPIFAVLHSVSSAVNIIRESGAGIVLDFHGADDIVNVFHKFSSMFLDFTNQHKKYKQIEINLDVFQQYSAKFVAAQLARLLDLIYES